MAKLINCLLILVLPFSMMADGLSSAKEKIFIKKIDDLVYKKLREKNQRPGKPISDEVFLRRVYLDTVGRIPTYSEAQRFLRSRINDKRSKLIDRLLSSPGYVSHNFNYWADVLRITSRMRRSRGENYMAFVKEAIRTDTPYNKFVYELLNANGAAYEHGNGATGYYLRDSGMPLDNLANTMQIFLGTSMVCAQCHDHPFDRWSQMDFYKLAAFNSGLNTRNRGKSDPRYKALGEIRKEAKEDPKLSKASRQVFDVLFTGVQHKGAGMIRLPHDYDYDDAKPHDIIKADVPYGEEVTLEYKETAQERKKKSKKKKKPSTGKDINSRGVFAKWVTSSQNPMFTKVIVNRMWDKVMGTPLVGPLTDLSLKYNGVNEELTAELQRQMKLMNYSLKDFTRVLLKSRTYQTEAMSIDLKGKEKNYFARPALKRLSAEQLWDSMLALAVENPDDKLPRREKVSSMEVIYEKTKNLDNQKLTALIYEARDQGRNFFKQFARDASGMNMAMGMASMTSMEADKRKMERDINKMRSDYKKLKKEISKAKSKKKPLLLKKLEDDKVALKEKIDQLSEKRRVTSNDSRREFTRASEIVSPAPPDHFLRRFGQSERDIIDGAISEASVPQALTLLNGKVEDYLTLNESSSINRHMAEAGSVTEKIRVAFLSTLCREPEQGELRMFERQFKSDQEQARRDLVWILINSNEFMFRK